MSLKYVLLSMLPTPYPAPFSFDKPQTRQKPNVLTFVGLPSHHRQAQLLLERNENHFWNYINSSFLMIYDVLDRVSRRDAEPKIS